MTTGTLATTGIVAGYTGSPVLDDVSVALLPAGVTALVGPNGSGKSTLLRTMAGLLSPVAGDVRLNGEQTRDLNGRTLARRLAFLPQAPLVPAGITVAELVEHGRHPYRRPLRPLGNDDREAIDWAMSVTDTGRLADRAVESLSGGERQRAWIALVLAQKTGVLLLDEPTTYLDLRYQVDVLNLVADLAADHQITVGLVLHDLNQAAAYADRMIVLSDGRVVTVGAPGDVMTAEVLQQAFGLDCPVVTDPVTGRPMCMPYVARNRAGG
jgi:ABC-type cobalamin/Fe3+-siderophores transport system ATPase subunit